ncbi:hypothetical protein FSP39_013294 [Pinctada imbricata]|uniref:KIF-binding protein n=1 Tax=Pinctada imbricata TaxID=66713 RepID=A0AA88YBJ7_PINIB|nr:hypothetical protein FSP39_013294 [Pinctada imbricata]
MATEWDEFMQVEGFERLEESRKLSEDESKNDPDEEPFRSKYKAREILEEMKKKVENLLESHPDNEMLTFYKAAFSLKLGANYLDTEELTDAQEHMCKCLELLENYKLHQDACSVYINGLNNLGLLWTTRQKMDTALEYLQRAENLYQRYKEEVGGAPKSYSEYFKRAEEDAERKEHDRKNHLESTYTHTLYYLAQVYAKQDDKERAAKYCHTTLERQLDEHQYDPLDWSLNAATLSQYYVSVTDLAQARHCLASAEVIYQEAESRDSGSESDEVKEKLLQSKADMERCWAKYGLLLLEASQDRLYQGDDENTDRQMRDVEDKAIQRFNLEVTSHEEQITDKFVLDFTDARNVFLKVQQWLNSAKTFYAFDDRYRRGLQFDDGSETVNIEEGGGNPSIHAVKKVNSLIHQSLGKYQQFLDSFKDAKKEMPDKFPELDIRPALIAKFCMGRLFSKLIVPTVQDKIKCVKQTEECYKYVCDYCDINPEAAELVPQELGVCREMVALLPLKMEKLRQEADS